MLVIVCPGQGSQTPGFLSPWLEVDGVRDLVDELGEAAQVDLLTHGTTSDEATIKDTAVAQPLIVGAGLACLHALLGRTAAPADVVGMTAGHSVGEFTAAAAAGVLTPVDALRLVGVRGRAMAEASAVTETGMSAVVGGAEPEVLAAIEAAGLTPANVNGAGQIVAAGTMAQLAVLAENPPAKARVIPLSVAGAFHTEHMRPAIAQLAAAANGVHVEDPAITLLSNADGAAVTDGADAVTKLVNQIANPVRWDLCMTTLADLGITGLIEVCPAGTLVGLAKRALRGTPAVAVKSPQDLDAARALLAGHAGGQ